MVIISVALVMVVIFSSPFLIVTWRLPQVSHRQLPFAILHPWLAANCCFPAYRPLSNYHTRIHLIGNCNVTTEIFIPAAVVVQ